MRIPGLRDLILPELTRRIWRKIDENRCPGRAAELGFFFFLALFPFLIFLISFLSFIPGADDFLVGYLGRFAPPEVMGLIRGWIDTIFIDRSGGLLSFSILFTLWSASSGTAALVDLLNTAYEVQEGRSFWRTRLLATWLTGALTLLVMGGAMLIPWGRIVLSFLLSQAGMGASFPGIGFAFSYIVGFAMLFAGLLLIYYFGPNVKQKGRGVMAGAFFALITITVVSYGFSFYLDIAPSLNVTYGSLGAVIAMMLWLYLISLVILIGGQINSELYRAARLPFVEKQRPLGPPPSRRPSP